MKKSIYRRTLQFYLFTFLFLCGHGALTMEKEKLKNSYHRFSVTLHAFLVLFTSNIVITFMKGRTQIFVWMMMIIIIIIIIIIIMIIFFFLNLKIDNFIKKNY